ncbi:acyltransferase family protein [Serratia fonticola]|uniref:acyltransferase family protein n=1 Tax=Serratia fonticola TaxID=47917 RepID=UPI001AE31B0B|nr:acyltransferase [Serratia fonticola]MBP1000336.1 acyltransferase [Serratia fonticola]MBP1004229.1 acyltransferase [Serratia fonticola]MBP1014221.1 acyltransferase [Serratia fonticola]
MSKLLMTSNTIDQFLNRGNNNLDLIRILCAYFVIYSHAFVISPAIGENDILYKLTLLSYVSFGGVAVKTFFLISGLLVTNSILSNGRILNYIGSRFFRVYPAYAVTIIITALLIGPWLSNLSFVDYFSSRDVWLYVLRTLKLDVQYTLPGVFENNNINAVNGSLWTIPMELKAYFYLLLIYLFSLVFGPYKKIFIGLISLAILVEPFTPFKGILISKSNDPSIYLLYPFFSIGCLIAILKDKATTNSLLIISGLSLLLFFTCNDEKLKTALFYLFFTVSLLYFASISLLQKLKIKHDISYGIYLWAFPTQQIVASIYSSSPYMNILISILISSAIAYLSFRAIEKPSMLINKRIFNLKSLPTTA